MKITILRYLRIIDLHQNISLGFMFGRVLPSSSLYPDVESLCQTLTVQPFNEDCRRQISEKQAQVNLSGSGNILSSSNLIFLGLLLSLKPDERLENPEGFFSSSQYHISVNGKPVVKNPDDPSPPNFEAKIASNMSFVVNENGTRFSVKIREHLLTGETVQPVPWGPHGEGPESWLQKLPLPFHWFVYSLRSTVTSFMYMNSETGEKITGGTRHHQLPVVAHLEKNWGNSFPKAWVWSEGVIPASGVSYAFSAGIVTGMGLDIKAQLSGYRNPGKQISCSFSPANSLHSLGVNSCTGQVILKVQSFTHVVVFEVSAPPKSFSVCLSAPMRDGFRKGCVESFVAVANITVYHRHVFSLTAIDTQTVYLSALEFGKAYMCDGQCPGT